MSTENSKPLIVALLATPASTASTLFGVHDILSGACRDWEMVVNGRTRASPIQPVIVARDLQAVAAANGVQIQPHAGFADLPEPDVVCITDMMVTPGQDLAGLFEHEVRWIRERYEAGATVTAVCTGAVLLAQAGLLEGQEATSHWAFCELLGRQYPTTRWVPEKALVTAGVGQRLVMAGSGTSWHTLALYLIARFVGAEAAVQAARLNVIDWSSTSPMAYAAMSHTAQVEDPVIARCQEWAAMHYQSESAVASMMRLSGLAERTFQRRFARATGHTPMDYVHTLRLEEAKQLLESTEIPIEAVALDVGYQDAAFFARLFKRKVCVTPAQYRRRFGALTRRLASVAAQG
jgi:transcriptional regulator GlxA family with amidase domain